MSTNKATVNAVLLKTTSDTESLEEFLNDEDFWSDLVDSINQNFVSEVEACHADDEQGVFNQMRKAERKIA